MAKNIKNKRERKKINAFDVVIILLILCLVGTFAYRVYDGVADPSWKKDSKYIVSFECVEEYNSLAKYLENGDAVYFEKNGELLGHLYSDAVGGSAVSIVGESASEVEADTKYIYEKVKLSGKLKLNADASYVSAGNYYTIGDINVSKGSSIRVCTEDAVFTLKVTGIEKIQ